jgi:non-specific serine/threonine protein kinase
LRILATSREALGIAGERVYQMPTLSLPESRHPTFADLLIEYESIRLFVERASAVKSDFTLNERNAAAVLAICRRLDGIPLALELAAARVKLLTVEHIAERLNDRFNLLTQGSRTALPRQQTLRAAIDWSYDQLLEEARVLFQRLSVFAGGFTLVAAEGICSEAPITPPTLLDVLTRLVDRSLINVERQGDDTRFRMLETIREYACEKLDAAGETARLRQRHRDFFIAFAEQAEPQLKGAAQFEWLDRLEVEHDNWRAAWDCAIESDAELALRLASALLDFWWMRGNPGEGREWLAKLLPRTESWGQTARRARALGIAGQLAYLQRDFASARALLVQSLAMARTAGDEREMAIALLWLARTAARQRDDPAAQAYSQECLAIYERLQDGWGMAMAISQSATMAVAQGQYAVAEERYLQSVAKFQALGDRFRMGFPLNGLGELARLLGDYERAGKFYGQHIELLRVQRRRGALLIPSVNMAWVSLHQGDYRQAQTLFEEGVKLSKEFGNQTTILSCLAGFASILAMTGKTAPAARLFGAVEALLEGIRMARRMDPADQKEFDHYVRAARAQMDETAFAQAWAEGRTMTLDQAVAYALQDKPRD